VDFNSRTHLAFGTAIKLALANRARLDGKIRAAVIRELSSGSMPTACEHAVLEGTEGRTGYPMRITRTAP
jgi:hypothetical protein